MKKMFCSFVFCCLCFWHLVAFADTDAVKSVMEGDSVTLNSSITEIKDRDLITWTFGDPGTKIAEINKEDGKLVEDLDGRFRDRLKLDEKTGSLNITNTRTEDTGVYQVIIKRTSNPTTYNFTVIVYARLPVPVISNSHCSSSSSSNCSLVCSSVLKVCDATLSWYKGISVLSSINASDRNISLSQPLEVEYQDKNTYSCVLNNPISNQTTHLDINTLCHTCPDFLTPLISAAAAGFLLLIAVVVIFCIYKKHRKTDKQDQARYEEITYADPTFYKRKAQKSSAKQEEDVVYAGVVTRR
ncbi:SLAM family member 5-like [Siphateles boraxobius]|uniref:SLAM family member 5-like n=1 Tax=Siphateles boraxobius TaxID=180520 RepID=UPI004064135E